MRICDIDFPESLLASQKDGNLAVFAGAGVSMPPPSNYPDFRELANQVAGGVLTREHEEPIDHFLGRLADRGTKIHRIVGRILTNPESRPNSLHLDLLRLFRTIDEVRLVTTNFDPHFSTAAAAVFPDGKRCETHYAPALPLGDSFSGIVFLHGGVDKPFERLVLTDSDFGRAYLTEGWARVFLQKLFERYTVLFVGYSHNDPVMNYLARGLPPQAGSRKRFALTAAGQEESWEYRGIIPVTYQLPAAGNPHSALPPALSAWATQVRLGELEQEQRIKAIVELPPPIDPEDSDFIESALSQPATARFFARHAKTIAWLKWVEERKFLKRLFDPRAALNEVDGELGQWFAQEFQCKFIGESLSLLRRQGGHLSPFLWNVLAHRLRLTAPNRPSSEALRRWVAVLLNNRPQGTDTMTLEHLSASLTYPGDTLPALLLFEYLSCPVIRLENDFWSDLQEEGSREDVRFALATNGDGFWLDHVWQRFFSPNLAALIDKIEPIVTSHLQRAYFLSRADGEADASWDPQSLSRNMIEQSDHGKLQGGLGVLVDVGFAVVEWNAQHRPPRSDALIDLWITADSFLLKRLAIFGVALNAHWTGDRKLAWLVGNDLLYKLGFKHEVFQVLKEAYLQASPESRKALLERARRGPQPIREGGERNAAYETYNLVYWLLQSDSECALAKSAFDVLQAAHPEFGKREQPDLEVIVSGPEWFVEKSPMTIDDLLSKAPMEQIEFLLSFVAETPFGPSREGLLEMTSGAVARKYEWGKELATELEVRGLWDVDLWSPILRGWTRADFGEKEWSEVLKFLDSSQKLYGPYVNELASLLKEGVKKPSQFIPDTCLPSAVDLSKRLWGSLVAQGGGVPEKIKYPEWLALAISHAAGDITLFWLSWLVRVRSEAGSKWQGIPEYIRKVLKLISDEPGYAGDLGRVLLASQVAFLSSVDDPWTKEHVLPLFDWAVDGKRAVQAFHGFLTWGRQTENLIPHLVPLYEKAFAHLQELGRLRERFVEYLAGLALASSINPITHGWLNRFVATVALEDRIRWSSELGRALRGTVDEGKILAWKSWIKPYWEQRILGLPLPLDAKELGEMVQWTLYLGPSFAEVVEVVWASPNFELKHSFLFDELADSELSQQHPTAAAKLLLKVLRNTHVYEYGLDKVEDTVRRIAPQEAPVDTLKEVCNELARLGYPAAAELQAWLDRGNF